VTLKLEGRVAGLWVSEFQRSWRAASSSLGSRSLVIDLCGVTHIDSAGRNALAEAYKERGAQFVADTPLTKYFAEEACRPKES
jgi:anti-anti-sigma regulatory factor